jgi:hypothetical protein
MSAGVLSSYDRIVITGTLPTVRYAEAMTRMTRSLYASGIRIFDHRAFAQRLRDRVRDGVAALAAPGATIGHLAKSHIRKDIQPIRPRQAIIQPPDLGLQCCRRLIAFR